MLFRLKFRYIYSSYNTPVTIKYISSLIEASSWNDPNLDIELKRKLSAFRGLAKTMTTGCNLIDTDYDIEVLSNEVQHDN